MRNVLLFLVSVALASSALGEGIVVSDSFKSVVPLYPGAKVVLSMKMEEGEQVHLESDAKSSDILDYYRKAMKEKGWSTQMDMALPEGGTIVFTRGKDKESLNVMATASSDKKIRVVLVLVQKK